MPVHLRLLGGVRLEAEGTLQPVAVDRQVSLLIYLAVKGTWVARSTMALLYGPDRPEEEALAYLRKIIHRARRVPWAQGLEVHGDLLRWPVTTDVGVFRDACLTGDWEEAVAQYGGPFLKDWNIVGAPGFLEWLEAERTDLETRWLQAAGKRIEQFEQVGDWAQASLLAGSMLEVDPLAEETLQMHIRNLVRDGRRHEARASFERFRDLLNEELGASPLESTQALADTLLSSQLPATSRAGGEIAPLPATTTSFVGRQWESRLAVTALQSGSRLVTAVGLGGSGKTRLAVELGRRLAPTFADGAAFVSLAGVQEKTDLAALLVEELNLSREAAKVTEALAHGLRDRHMLLILDNFETVRGQASLLAHLLERAPRLVLLVTSREPLLLLGEQVVEVGGLATPPDGVRDGLDDFDAVRLFIERAVRLAPQYAPGDEDRWAIAEISRRVEGLPLALELAASWLPLFTPQEFLARMDESPQLLRAELADLPSRHRNLWNVFEYTWERLGEKEREALEGLTVFRGGFTLAGARAVAGADLDTLLKLLQRTVVRRIGVDRFELHGLVAQFVRDKGAPESARNSHTRYYCNLLKSLGPDLQGRDVGKALAAIQLELGNIEAAWERAVEAVDLESLEGAREALSNYLYYRGRYDAGTEAFERAVAAVGDPHRDADPAGARLVGRLLLHQADHLGATGEPMKAQQLVEKALRQLEAYGTELDVGYARQLLGECLSRQSRYADAVPHFRAAVEAAERFGDQYLLGAGYNGLGNTTSMAAANLEEALDFYRASLRAHRATGNLHAMSGALINLGATRFDMHDFDEAERLWREAAGVARQLGYQGREAILESNLGALAESRGDMASAWDHYRRSLEVRKEIGDRTGVATVLLNTGRLLFASKRYSEARTGMQEALEIYLEVGDDSGAAHARSLLARVLGKLGRQDEAMREALLSLRTALDIDSRVDLLSALLTVALLQESGGRSAEAIRTARVVCHWARNHSQTIRREVRELLARLGAAPAPVPYGDLVDLAHEFLRPTPTLS